MVKLIKIILIKKVIECIMFKLSIIIPLNTHIDIKIYIDIRLYCPHTYLYYIYISDCLLM